MGYYLNPAWNSEDECICIPLYPSQWESLGEYGFYYKNLTITDDIKKTFKYMIFGLYFAAILSIVGFPNLEELRIDLSINLIPLIDLKSDYLNATLNILLFIPFGFIGNTF